MLRVVEILKNDFAVYNQGGATKVEERIKWEGESIIDLSRTFPPSEVVFADPLGHSEIEDGLIRWDYRFERLVDGEWVEIEDPRVRLDPTLSAAEREQEAYNRFHFPDDADDDDWI